MAINAVNWKNALLRLITIAPAQDGVAITPSDTVNLTIACRAIWVGTAGDITLVTIGANVITLKNVPVGLLPVGCSRVNATSTTASNLVALY